MYGENELAARRYLYQAFQCLMGNDPADEGFAALDADLLEEACEILGVDSAAGVASAIAGAQSEKASLEQLRGQYMTALVGPGKIASPPWESAQISGDGALFSRITLDVRNAYRACGLLPEEYPRVSDDHIALECGFLAALALRAFDADQSGDSAARDAALASSSEFLKAHLLRWSAAFAESMDSERTPFYAEAAQLLDAFLRVDVEGLKAT